MSAVETLPQMCDRLIKEHAATPREDRPAHLVSAWQQMGYSGPFLSRMVAAANPEDLTHLDTCPRCNPDARPTQQEDS